MRTIRIRQRGIVASMALLMSLASLSVAAPGSGADPVEPVVSETTRPYCVAYADPVIDGVVVPDPDALPFACFETAAAAVEYGSKGFAQVPAGADLDAALAALHDQVQQWLYTFNDHVDTAYPDGYGPPQAAHIGTDKDWDWVNEQLVWFVSNAAGCTEGVQYQRADMPSGWNDKVDAAVTAGGCDVWDHFQHRNFNMEQQGASIACRDTGNCSDADNMGDMRNHTSSERWSRAGFKPPSAQIHIRDLPGSHDA